MKTHVSFTECMCWWKIPGPIKNIHICVYIFPVKSYYQVYKVYSLEEEKQKILK